MDNKKPYEVITADGCTHFFASLENAERHARAVVGHGHPIFIWQNDEIIARVSADKLKRTRMRKYG